ncbi:conjugal transfer pilus assembly protein TraV [Marinobacter nauticus]|uniref:Conjugal transfer pilus assembly protein TraV n=1 Tax=Marinobacter nauticus TaxID=2743 RepID=A0A368X7X5_MARNT|nr:type IV conjugative transfer system lipoprotein TraV [Marinobacter nauticus]RCW64063.1 conjugal transfer pilus assembly protein TraV [Marinobacter nauticus]|tara:strand:- start:1640 stop:2266 length:627 start_codon:yes stop_codon:yes gene_type:complete
MKFVRALIVGAGVSVVSGCASLGVGDSEFSCSGLPEATTCMSAREVYEATAHGGTIYDRDYSGANTVVANDPSSFGGTGPLSKEQRLSGVASTSTSGVQTEQIVRKIEDRYVAPSVPNKPVPIRTPAQVMRVWIAPWEDKNENLKISSYVFTEIEARKWMYDMRGVARGETIQPLQVIRADGDEINVDKRGHRNNRPTFDGSLPAPAQ